jgi:hypothetical protein
MADTVRVESGEGSAENVAYKLMGIIRNQEAGKYNSKKDVLDLYAECVHAAKGYRDIPK